MAKIIVKITVDEKKKDAVFVECKDASIAQNFLTEDIPALLIDIPKLIDKK